MVKKAFSPQIEMIKPDEIPKPSWDLDTSDEAEHLNDHVEPDESKIKTKVELSIIKLSPKRLPRGYSSCLIICAYIPEWVVTKQNTSMWQLGKMIENAITSNTNSNKPLVFVAGDLNGVDIGTFCHEYKLHQINKNPTRKERCLDVALTNAPKCYSSQNWPPLDSGSN